MEEKKRENDKKFLFSFFSFFFSFSLFSCLLGVVGGGKEAGK